MTRALRLASGRGLLLFIAGPTIRKEWGSVSQQALEGTFLVRLVGDIRQVDTPEVWGMIQNHITHLKGEDVVFQVIF